mmetsp:Transcript_133069/g.384929  ORF Transcript_133069/g.384929 Transcript_133069/m.384929 type:complete len:171 (+) Transcript_133069:67-579(+)
MAAVRHWTGEKRLPAEECQEWDQNPRLMLILRELRQLQHACHLAGIKVPLEAVLGKSDIINFPDGSRLFEGKLLPKPEEAPKEASKEAPEGEKPMATPEERLAQEDREAERCRSVAWSRQKFQLKWQLAAGIVALLAARLAMWWNPEPDPDGWFNMTDAMAAVAPGAEGA